MISSRVLSLVCRASPNQLKLARSLVVASSFCVNRKSAVTSFKDKKLGTRWLSTTTSEAPQKLKPYVGHPYSYAWGSSNKALVYDTIGDLLQRRAAEPKQETAIISHHEGISATFAELQRDVDKLAKSFYEKLGLRRGDVVALWSLNCYHWVVAQYATAKLGAILVTVNPVYRAPELEYALRKARAKCLIMPGKGSPQESITPYKKILDHDRMNQKSEEKLSDYQIENVVYLDGENEAVKTMPNAETHSLRELLENDGRLPEEATRDVEADDPALIMFTSGTTGKPKGAFLSHFTIVNNALLTGKSLVHKDERRVVCIPLPLFHSFAGVLGSIGMTASDSTMVFTGYKFDTPTIVDVLVKHQCTHIMLTPTMIIDILQHIAKNDIKGLNLKACTIGGAAVPAEVAHKIQKIIPSCHDVRIGYGATELGPCTTLSYPHDSVEERMETVGTPLDFVEVKVVNPQTGKIVKIGEQGELLSRGHNVMLGYWDEPEKTREAMANQWYKSGDLGVMTPDGFLKIVGRTKELIIRGGENIYPREVEEMLHTHPDIVDAYVIGVPDERTGEELCAWIKLKNKEQKISAEEIKEFCKDKISYFKIPKYILFVDDFPLTTTGKAKKFIMREESCKILGLKELK